MVTLDGGVSPNLDRLAFERLFNEHLDRGSGVAAVALQVTHQRAKTMHAREAQHDGIHVVILAVPLEKILRGDLADDIGRVRPDKARQVVLRDRLRARDVPINLVRTRHDEAVDAVLSRKLQQLIVAHHVHVKKSFKRELMLRQGDGQIDNRLNVLGRQFVIIRIVEQVKLQERYALRAQELRGLRIPAKRQNLAPLLGQFNRKILSDIARRTGNNDHTLDASLLY
ncbi:hypothetical protein SDC9_134716 [bioreactor metagenome]|uniref:Uncharacterized protein n=1 Tax=bioreactor metagenome TaxID=1076179 RepID=A0A645DE16_9ZZZZ